MIADLAMPILPTKDKAISLRLIIYVFIDLPESDMPGIYSIPVRKHLVDFAPNVLI